MDDHEAPRHARSVWVLLRQSKAFGDTIANDSPHASYLARSCVWLMKALVEKGRTDDLAYGSRFMLFPGCRLIFRHNSDPAPPTTGTKVWHSGKSAFSASMPTWDAGTVSFVAAARDRTRFDIDTRSHGSPYEVEYRPATLSRVARPKCRRLQHWDAWHRQAVPYLPPPAISARRSVEKASLVNTLRPIAPLESSMVVNTITKAMRA